MAELQNESKNEKPPRQLKQFENKNVRRRGNRSLASAFVNAKSKLTSALRQPQLSVLWNHDLMPFAVVPVEYAQHLVDLRIGIPAHAAVIHDYEEMAFMLVAAQLLSDVYEMSRSTVVGAHDVQFAIMPLVTRVRIEFQVDVSVFGKAELLYISIPVTDADEKLFDVIARRIDTQVPVVDVKLQDSVMQERPHLRSYIDAAVSGAVLGSDQLTALRCRWACKKKQECQTTDQSCE
jgi:hypothetical protein